MTDLTPERRAELRHDAQRRRLFRFVTGTASDGYPSAGYESIDDDILALLDAADERDGLLTVVPCSETRTEPFDFAYCSTHDTTFGLSDHCYYAGLSEFDYMEKQATEQRVRAIRAEHERDRLAAAVERVRALADYWERLDRAFLAAGTAGMSMYAVDAVRQLRERLSPLDGTDDRPTP